MSAAVADPSQIIEAFWWFDRNGGGVISRDELARVMRSLSPDWQDSKLDLLLQAANLNTDGLINYEKFVSFLTGRDIEWDKARKDVMEKRGALAERQDAADRLSDQLARDLAAIERISAESSDSFEAALPALELAATALEGLSQEDLRERAAVAGTPPASMMTVMTCVCLLRPMANYPEAGSWDETYKVMLDDEALLPALLRYPKDNVSADQVAAVKARLQKDHDVAGGGYGAQSIGKVGDAFLLWVKAVVAYYDGAQASSSAMQRAADLHKRVAETEKELAKVNQELSALTQGGPCA